MPVAWVAMAKTDFASIDAYLATLPEAARSVLEEVRAVLMKAIPGAEEAISYQIPTLRLCGKNVLHFAAWKAHYALYPASARVVAELGEALAPYDVSKGTIKLPYTKVPRALLAKVAKVRAAEHKESVASAGKVRGAAQATGAGKVEGPKKPATAKKPVTKPRAGRG